LGTVWVSDVLAWLKQKACDDIAAERAVRASIHHASPLITQMSLPQSKDASIPDECPICFETVGADAVITPCKVGGLASRIVYDLLLNLWSTLAHILLWLH